MNTQVKIIDGADYEIPSTAVMVELLKANTRSYPESAETTMTYMIDKESIFSLKTYEYEAVVLPGDMGSIQNELGNGIDIDGLRNQDILDLYLSIKSNASKWGGLEKSIISNAQDIEIYASDVLKKSKVATQKIEDIILKYGGEIFDIDPDQLYDQDYIKEIIQKIIDSMSDPDADLNADEDALTLRLCKIMVDDLLDGAKGYLSSTQQLRDNIGDFHSGLNECHDNVLNKREIIKKNHIEDEIEELEERRDELEEDIKIQQAAYDKNVGLAFTGAAGAFTGIGLPIGLAITGGIFGSKAEKIRKKIKELKSELSKVNDEIKRKTAIKAAIEKLSPEFKGLGTVLVQADKGLMDIEAAWDGIVKNLELAVKDLDDVEQAKDLVEFWGNLSLISGPWENVQGLTGDVVKAFQGALEEWANNNKAA